MNQAEMQHQDELEMQERVLHDLRYLFLVAPSLDRRAVEACSNIAGALGLSKEFKQLMGG